jgi:hypothetical protein
MLAPPWITVPPVGYGGIEAVVALLSDALVARGHHVTLFAAPGSTSAGELHATLARSHPDQIGSSLYESDHVGAAYDVVDQAGAAGQPFDVVHDHSGFTAVAMAARVSVPVIHTLHAPFDDETRPFYTRHGHKTHLVAISHYQLAHAPPGVHVADVVPNPVRIEDWPFREHKDDYVLWMGRMDPAKGAHRAIVAARLAGVRLVLAGPVQPGQEKYFHNEIAPHIDNRDVVYVGEVAGARHKELFAHAKGFLMPIRWPEPFGMVMVEALACGTPVIVFPEGAASEIVIDGRTGFHAADEQAMADAVGLLDTIDPRRCRESVASRYDTAIIADRYETIYRNVIQATKSSARPDRARPSHKNFPGEPPSRHGTAGRGTGRRDGPPPTTIAAPLDATPTTAAPVPTSAGT